MTTFDEAECLKVNPFEGDFGSPGDKVLKDKIGTARKGFLAFGVVVEPVTHACEQRRAKWDKT